MKLKMLLGLLFSLLTLAMFGCGDDGGTSTKVNGSAVAGIISGGTVTFNSIDAAGVVGATKLATTPAVVTTAADGTYTATIGYAGPLLVTVTGGSYVDEATGLTVTLATPLRAALPNASGTVTGVVTPLTEVAVQKAGTLTAANITASNTAISALVGVADIVTTSPADPTYKAPLQTVSQAQKDQNVDLATALANLSAGITISGTTATLDPATQAIIDTATTNIATNPNIAATVVALTASPATGVITSTSGVTLTATVTLASNNQPVADGAIVNFTITSGTGTLSAASAATAGGVASVTLSSTVAGASVTVSAAAANTPTPGTVVVPFINDPNAPGIVTITANPTSAFVNQSVVITATVAPAGAGGVVANGTTVTFASTLGTFSAITTTTGGVATATLNTGATAGTASITASAGGNTSAPLSFVIGSQPTLAIVKLATSGTLPVGTTIGGINCDVIANPSAGLTIAAADVTATGAGAAALLTPNANNVADVILAAISATGIQAGEFATLNYHVAVGTFPTAADFTIAAGASVIDTNGLTIPGITVVIQSVTIQ